MSRLKLPKPGFGMRWAPPSAERIVLLVENLLADENYVLSLDESLRQAIGDEEYLFVSAALLGLDRTVFARVVVAASSRLFFIEPETGLVMRSRGMRCADSTYRLHPRRTMTP